MKKALTGNTFLDFANDIAARYKGIPGAFDAPMMNYLAEEKPEQSEETPLPASITYINDITNIKEENILYQNNISFLTNILQKQFYKNFFPTVRENVEKIVKETVISENEKIYEKVSENAEKIAYDKRDELVSQISTQIINRISEGSTDTLEYLRSVPELAGKEEVLYRRILNVLPEKKKEEAGIVTTKMMPMLAVDNVSGRKVFKMADVPVVRPEKTEKSVRNNSDNSTSAVYSVNNNTVNNTVNNNTANNNTVNNAVNNNTVNNNTANSSSVNNNIVNNNIVNNRSADNGSINIDISDTVNNSKTEISADNGVVINNDGVVTNTAFNSESFKTDVFNSSNVTSNVFTNGAAAVVRDKKPAVSSHYGQELVYLEGNEVQGNADGDTGSNNTGSNPAGSNSTESGKVTSGKVISFENSHDKALVVKLVSDIIDKTVSDEVGNISANKKGNAILHNAEILNNVLYQATEERLEKYYDTVFHKNIFENENIRTLVKNVITNKVYRKISEFVTQENLSEIQLDEENVTNIRNIVQKSYKDIIRIVTVNVTESVTKNIEKNTLVNAGESISENISENISEDIAENISESMSENITTNISRNISENVSRNISKNFSENILENSTVSVSEDVTELIHDDISEYLSENKYGDSPKIRPGIAASDDSVNRAENASYSPLSLEYNSTEDEEERQMLERVSSSIAPATEAAIIGKSFADGLDVSEILTSARTKAMQSGSTENEAIAPTELTFKANASSNKKLADSAFDFSNILNSAETLILQYVPKEQVEKLYGSTAVMAARSVAKNELDHVILEYARGDVSKQAAGDRIESIISRVEKAYSDAGASYVTDTILKSDDNGNINLILQNAGDRLAVSQESIRTGSQAGRRTGTQPGRQTGSNSGNMPMSLSYNPEILSASDQPLYDEASLVYGIDTTQRQEELTRQTKVLTEQVKEVQKNITVVNQENIVNEKEITGIAEKVVKNIVKQELENPDNVSETKEMIRRETSAQVNGQIDENISHITDRVYQKLEQRLRTERGRRGLI